MNPIQTLSSTNPLSALIPSTDAAAAKKGDEVQERFLTLLVSQLKNQDPLNPLDNAQVTTQMAQLSTVEGLQNIDHLLQSMSGRFDTLQTLQASDLVGRHVLIDGADIDLHQGSAPGTFELSQAVDQLVVSIRDASGKELRQLDLGAREAGLQQFDWDGLTDAGVAAINGRYQFNVTATAAGKPVDVTRYAIARVDGVVQGDQGATLRLGGYGTVAFDQVKQIV